MRQSDRYIWGAFVGLALLGGACSQVPAPPAPARNATYESPDHSAWVQDCHQRLCTYRKVVDVAGTRCLIVTSGASGSGPAVSCDWRTKQ